MPTLLTALTDPAAAGIFRVPARLSVVALARRIAATDARLALLPGGAITDKGTFLRAAADALAFPPYFGRNWDAFADCLTDLSWLPAPGYAILYDNPAPLIRQSPQDWAAAAEVFGAAAERWRVAGVPFVVLLRRAAGLAPTIPLLED
ncbi:MAG TPA: barstar family protein [Thermomicrobiales bacterium]|jgi:hypothetical protein